MAGSIDRWINMKMKNIGAMSLMLIVLPEFNPIDMTYRQVRTYLESPTLSTSAPSNMESVHNLTFLGSYPIIAGLSIGIILFSMISVYFHNRKKKKDSPNSFN